MTDLFIEKKEEEPPEVVENDEQGGEAEKELRKQEKVKFRTELAVLRYPPPLPYEGEPPPVPGAFDVDAKGMFRQPGDMVEHDASKVVQDSISSKDKAGKADTQQKSAIWHLDPLSILARGAGVSPNLIGRLSYPCKPGTQSGGNTTLRNVCELVGSRLIVSVADLVSYEKTGDSSIRLIINKVNIVKYQVTKEELLAACLPIYSNFAKRRFKSLDDHMQSFVRSNKTKGSDIKNYVKATDFSFVRLRFASWAYKREDTQKEWTTTVSEDWFRENATQNRRFPERDRPGAYAYAVSDDLKDKVAFFHNFEVPADEEGNISVTYVDVSYTTLYFHNDILRIWGLTAKYIAECLWYGDQESDTVFRQNKGDPYSLITCRTALLEFPVNENMLVAYSITADSADEIARCLYGPKNIMQVTEINSILTNVISVFISGGMTYHQQSLYAARVQLSIIKSFERFYYDVSRSGFLVLPGRFVHLDENAATRSTLSTAATVTFGGVRKTVTTMSFMPPNAIDFIGTVGTGAPMFSDPSLLEYKDPYAEYDIYAKDS